MARSVVDLPPTGHQPVAIDEACNEVKDAFAGKKIILGHDPMSSLSGLDKKLQAFERFLHEYLEWRERTVLVQMTSPVMLKANGNDEADFVSRVSRLVGSINARYGSLGHTPVQLSPLPPQQDMYFALLRRSDLALITSVREGISTTALEYAICQRDRHGTLILSEFSGTASTLSKAVVVNPWDVSAVAREIYKALVATSEDRAASHAALLRQVQDISVERWARKLFVVLERDPEKEESDKAKTNPLFE